MSEEGCGTEGWEWQTPEARVSQMPPPHFKQSPALQVFPGVGLRVFTVRPGMPWSSHLAEGRPRAVKPPPICLRGLGG